MATSSTNQARHLYVVKEIKSPHVLESDNVGSIAVNTIGNGEDKCVFFEYKGAGGLVRSDLIKVKDVLWSKAIYAASFRRELKSATVTLDSNINRGNPVAGQDYILRITFNQYIGISDTDQYQKYGMVHAYSGMTASDFYKKLALSLVKNFSREATPLVKFTLTNSSNEAVPVDITTKESSLTDTYTALVIDEVEQPWKLGVMEQTSVYFEIQPVPITVEGDERIWGIIEDTEPAGFVHSGKKIADLEYFCMGERGDVYRGAGFPNNISTTYLVDPNKEYNIIEIHYAYVGSNESVQKSEKTITIAIEASYISEESDSLDNEDSNILIGYINNAGIKMTALPEY